MPNMKNVGTKMEIWGTSSLTGFSSSINWILLEAIYYTEKTK